MKKTLLDDLYIAGLCVILLLWPTISWYKPVICPRYGFNGIYQPRDFVARLINPMETFTSVYNLYIYICTYVCIYIHTYIHTYIYTYIHTYIYIYVHTHTHTHTHTNTHIHICIHTYIHTHRRRNLKKVGGLNIFVHSFTCKSIHFKNEN